MLLIVCGIAAAVGSIVLPDWSMYGDQTDYWIAENLDLYVSLAAVGLGLAWFAAVLVVEELKGRRRHRW